MPTTLTRAGDSAIASRVLEPSQPASGQPATPAPLLGKPHGFDGLLAALKPRDAHDLPVPHRPNPVEARDHLNAACPPEPAMTYHGEDMLSRVDQLLDLVSDVLEP